MYWNERLARCDLFSMRDLVAKAEHVQPQRLSRSYLPHPYDLATLLLIQVTRILATQVAVSWTLVSTPPERRLCYTFPLLALFSVAALKNNKLLGLTFLTVLVYGLHFSTQHFSSSSQNINLWPRHNAPTLRIRIMNVIFDQSEESNLIVFPITLLFTRG